MRNLLLYAPCLPIYFFDFWSYSSLILFFTVFHTFATVRLLSYVPCLSQSFSRFPSQWGSFSPGLIVLTSSLFCPLPTQCVCVMCSHIFIFTFIFPRFAFSLSLSASTPFLLFIFPSQSFFHYLSASLTLSSSSNFLVHSFPNSTTVFMLYLVTFALSQLFHYLSLSSSSFIPLSFYVYFHFLRYSFFLCFSPFFLSHFHTLSLSLTLSVFLYSSTSFLF